MYESNRIHNITNNTYYNAAPFSQAGQPNKLAVYGTWIISAFVVIIMMIVMFRSTGKNSNTTTPLAVQERQKTIASTAVLTADGPQFWKIVSRDKGQDSHRYFLTREDVHTHKQVSEEKLTDELDWGQYLQSAYNRAEWLSYGRYCFLLYDNNSRIRAYDARTGELIWDEKTFAHHYPEFNSQVVEMDEESSTYRRFYIKAANGLTYYYFADADTVISKEAFDKMGYSYRFTHALKDTVYFSFAEKQTTDGKYMELFRIHRVASLKNPRNGYYFEDDYARRLQYERDRAEDGIKDYASITPSVRYFKPRRVFQDGKRVVVIYHADANDKGALVASLIQADGKILFTHSGSELEPIRDLLTSSHEQFEYKNRLYFYAQRQEAEVAVLNLETGKLDMHYKEENP